MEKRDRPELGEILRILLEEDDPRAHINQRDECCCIVDGEFNLQEVAMRFHRMLSTSGASPS